MTQNILSRIFPNLSHGLVQVFGSAGSGKTSFLLSLAKEAAIQGSRVIFFDCPNKVSSTKFGEVLITKQHLEKVTVFCPKDLKDLIYTLDDLDVFLVPSASLILIDDPFSLYYPKVQEKGFGFKVSKDLSQIFALACQLSKNVERPIFIANQVRGRKEGKVPYLTQVTKRYIDYDLHLTRERGTNLIWGSIFKEGTKCITNLRFILVKEGIRLVS
ncbi:MAG: AAA family ATPase [Promethearchaeota archaeon]